MSNILFLSENEVFKIDALDQIRHHASGFGLTEEESAADVIVIDEDQTQLDNLLKKDVKAPIIFLTQTERDFDAKIHQVIYKPFNLNFFLDAIKAAVNIFENSADGTLAFNDYVLYPARKEIFNQRNNETTKLTEKEVAIIKYLYKNQNRIVGKNDLMQEVWGYAADATTHTVETHIYRLRQKVEHDDAEAQMILTSDGGYQLVKHKKGG